MIDQSEMNTLLDAGSDLADQISAWQRDDQHDRFDLGKLWDALHFVLNGVTASEPLEDDPLSDAIVGVQLFFEDDDADFIAFTPNPDLPAIITALKAIDLPNRTRAFAPTTRQRMDAYPDGILDGDREQLVTELFVAFESLINFYETALDSKRHVVVSIL